MRSRGAHPNLTTCTTNPDTQQVLMTSPATRPQRFLLPALLCAVIAICVVGTAQALHRRFAPSPMLGRALRPGEKPAPDATDETQDVVILLGTSACHFGNDTRFKTAFHTIAAAVGQRAHDQSHTLLRLGVAMDDDVNVGADWLRSIGDFDEFDVGGNWLNNAVVGYLWDSRALPGIPQVVILRRQIHRTLGDGARINVAPPTILHRASGLDGIQALADSLRRS